MSCKVNYIFFVMILYRVRGISLGISLHQPTEKADYSDVYEKIDENDIFRHLRKIMRNGDAANGVPRMAPFLRTIHFSSQK